MLTLGAVILGAACTWILPSFAFRRWQEAKLARVCRTRGVVVLSYDDGPGPELTPRLLDLFREKGVKATFFFLGRNAEDEAAIVRDLLADGHELGSHTYNHTNAWKADPIRAARDFQAGADFIQGLGGDGRLFRPPYGKLTLAGLAHGLAARVRFGWWTIDSRDSWRPREVGDILNEIERQNGGVILMHDWDDYGPDHDHVAATLTLTRRIIEFAERKGLEVRPLGDLLKDAA